MLRSYADNIVPYAGDYCDRTYGTKPGQEARPFPDIRFVDADAERDAAAVPGSPQAILRKPDAIKADVWERLNQRQKLARWSREWFRANAGLLTDSERMRIGISLREGRDLDEEALLLLLRMEASTARCADNKTWPQLMDCVQDAQARRRPLEFVLSQCLDKNPALWRAAVEDSLGLPVGRVDSFLQMIDGKASYKPKGWAGLQQLREAIAPYPSKVTLLLGDQDFYTFGRGMNTGTEVAREELESAVRGVRERTRQQAEAVFGKGEADVKLWSELYTIADYNQALTEANATKQNWLTPEFAGQMEQYYLGTWASTYGPIARQLGLDMRDDLPMFVRDDTVRISAQYTLEARIIARRKAIQLWGAESTMPPSLCMRISNYDKDPADPLPPTLTIPS